MCSSMSSLVESPKEFTFIVLTYNHEAYVREHLESIKYQITTFGQDMFFDLIIADDNSRDETIVVAQEWLKQNNELFRDICLLQQNPNVGTVKNIQMAIERVKTTSFKFLAGDDKYYINNIFELFDSRAFIITPVLPFGRYEKIIPYLKNSYRLLLLHNSVAKLCKLLCYGNFLPAPGVFVSDTCYKDGDLWKTLSNFRLIEDYPSWYYIFHKYKDINLKILTTPYVCYRVGNGVSTNQSGVSQAYLDDEKKVFEYVEYKLNKQPKLLNVYKYKFWLMKKIAACARNEDIQKIDTMYEQLDKEEK